MSIQWHKSTCPYCGFGCGLMVGVDQGKVVRVQGMKDHPTNKGDICSLALSCPYIFTDNDRLKRPTIRRSGQLILVLWDEAITHVAAGFKRIIKEHGPGTLAFYGGAINLTEEYYLMNKLMKAAIGTNNMDSSTHLCMASTSIGFLFIEIYPEDASRMDIVEGEEVDAISRQGSVCLLARFTNSLLLSTVFIPWHYGSALWVDENRLSQTRPMTFTPSSQNISSALLRYQKANLSQIG